MSADVFAIRFANVTEWNRLVRIHSCKIHFIISRKLKKLKSRGITTFY